MQVAHIAKKLRFIPITSSTAAIAVVRWRLKKRLWIYDLCVGLAPATYRFSDV